MSVCNNSITKKVINLVLLLLLVSFLSMGQSYDNAIIEIEQKLNNHTKKDNIRVDLFNELSYAYRRSSPEKIDSFARLAFNLATELNYIKGKAIAYKNLGIAIGRLRSNMDTVIYFFQKCYELAQQSEDYYSQAACSNNLGFGYSSSLRYDEAINAYLNALAIHSKHFPVDRLQMLIIGNIGGAYVNMKDYANASMYFEEVFNLADKYNNKEITVMYMKDYAFVHYSQGRIEEAIKTITENLPLANEIGDYLTFVQATVKLTNILIEEQQYNKAATYIKQGLEVSEKHNFSIQRCAIMLNRSKVLFNKNKLTLAQKDGEAAYRCSEGNNQQQIKAIKNLLNIYLTTNNSNKAKELFQLYNELTEKHFNTERQKTASELEIKHQNEKKQTENEFLKVKQTENEGTIKKQKILVFLIFMLGLIATGAALFAYRVKQTQNSLLEEKVTKRTKALNDSNQELAHANIALEKSNEELERFAYIASHDLKQPINTIISFTGLLSKELKDKVDEKTNTYLKYVINGSNQMKQLIEDVLEFSKLNEEIREEQLIDLNDLVDEVKMSLCDLIDRKNATVNVIGLLPTIKNEKSKLLLLFKNFIENGIKYNQSKNPIINIAQTKVDLFTRISFSDNGIGIEEKYFPKIFKMFCRLHSNAYDGTGLGLSLCKKIVSNMGGIVSVESKLGKGSIFCVDIPNDLFVKNWLGNYSMAST